MRTQVGIVGAGPAGLSAALVLGRATRLAQFMSGADKEYVADVRFGTATDTYDAQGQPTGERYVVAARVHGKLKSAYPNGAPEGADGQPPGLMPVTMDGFVSQPTSFAHWMGGMIEQMGRDAVDKNSSGAPRPVLGCFDP